MTKEIKDLTREEIKAMSREERQALHTHFFAVYDLGEEDRVYWLLHEVEDEEYYEENIEKFREYESHMNEPDFDWDFYSDWHKDMYGYRPHKRVIPKDDTERREICESWHRARGL
jgi:hypothetical protein